MSALAVFYLFMNLKMCYSKIINTISKTTLGVYCFHQVPAFYMFLWNGIFNAKVHAGSSNQCFYTLGIVFIVFLLGVFIELIREKFANICIENRRWYKNMCRYIDDFFFEKGDEKCV